MAEPTINFRDVDGKNPYEVSVSETGTIRFAHDDIRKATDMNEDTNRFAVLRRWLRLNHKLEKSKND